jgi:3-hydroxyacyl-CoA dehydrogenase
MSRFQVKKVAVLGAGVMGAQIAAHLVNVKVPVVLFDLPAKEGPKNGIVTKAIDRPEEAQARAFGCGR